MSEAGRVALGCGAVLFLLGFVLGRYRVVRAIAWERVVAGAAALAFALLLDGIAAVALMAIVLGVLVAMLVIENYRLQEVRAALRTD